jgi:hypothetical protein
MALFHFHRRSRFYLPVFAVMKGKEERTFNEKSFYSKDDLGLNFPFLFRFFGCCLSPQHYLFFSWNVTQDPESTTQFLK